ncbi:MAG: iron permease, partial [Nitrosarchaeum sp.]|nr:iron permease [Nitrosarchaeum sp.]
IIVDEQYQASKTENNDSSYRLSKSIAQRSLELFEFTNYDQRLSQEIRAFLEDLKQKIDTNDEFVSVGTLITAINRDLIGTETVVYDKQNLYQTIRDLYAELLVMVDEGDYEKAESLAIEAYLENFEYLESDIELVDSER